MVTGHTHDVGKEEQHHSHGDKMKDKITHSKLYQWKASASHLKHRMGKFGNLLNGNHRHDEEHEKETDEKRTRVAEGHRFQSFAPERDGNDIKWYIDGRDYFHAVSVALERAKESIYIADWWLSPELFLRRPPHAQQKWRLDATLKRAAERGVKIYIIVYREVAAALTCDSQHTKRALMGLCPEGTPGHGNIVVMRHPDHNVFENAADMTFYWAHHEKFIVIDYNVAFIGGLDLCFGRWDYRQHPLADAHPQDVTEEIFPGQDFNNNRIMDFQNVQDWKSNALDKTQYGRMPWHDVAMGLIGPCIYDIAEHFVLRWNFVKRDKYKRDKRYDWLTLTGRTGDMEDLVGVQRPQFPVGDYVHQPLSPLETKAGNPDQGQTEQHPDILENDEGQVQMQENPNVTGNTPKKEGMIAASGGIREKHVGYASHKAGTLESVAAGHGSVHAQLVRSSADWSSGILAEQSIQNAYCQVIREAHHYVYIENQFFICATGEHQAPIHNQIGAAIVDAVVAAARDNRKFRVIIMLPTIPGFAGDLREDAATGTRAIMDYQYKSLCRGEHSIYGRISAAGVDPTEYIFAFNLRSYDRVDNTPALEEQEAKSGVKYQDVQKAHAEEIMAEGRHADADTDDASSIQGEKSKEHGFHKLIDKVKSLTVSRKDGENEKPAELENLSPAELAERRRKFEEQKQETLEDSARTKDSIAQNALLGEKLVSQEFWPGRNEDGTINGEEEADKDLRQKELATLVQEELYIHGKILIVDDRIVICGSSNINDRSQLGFHDSELSIVMEDRRPLASRMNHQPYTAGHHAATLRRMLWREHLGLLPAQTLDASGDINAQPPGDGANDFCATDEWDDFVADPLSDDLWEMWTSRASTNTQVFRHIFHADPDDNVRTFEDYDNFLGKVGSRKTGHVYDAFQPIEIARKELDKIRGHLVWMPLKFLEDADMAERGLQVNDLTESVYT